MQLEDNHGNVFNGTMFRGLLKTILGNNVLQNAVSNTNHTSKTILLLGKHDFTLSNSNIINNVKKHGS